jgi:DNA-binding response OmpR family regulator
MRILLVEDDEAVAAFVAGGLAQEGFSIDTAAEGRDACSQRHSRIGPVLTPERPLATVCFQAPETAH